MAQLRPSAMNMVEADDRNLPVLYKTAEELVQSDLRLQTRLRQRNAAGAAAAAGARAPQPAASLQLVATTQHIADIEKLDRNLLPLENLRATIQDVQPKQTRAPGAVEYKFHERIVVDVIQQTLESLKDDADRELASALDQDWAVAKNRLLQEMSAAESENVQRQQITAAPVITRVLSPLDDLAGNKPRDETPKMAAYYSALSSTYGRMKESFRSSGPFEEVTKAFSDAAVAVGSNPDALEMWSLIQFMIQPPPKDTAIRTVHPWPSTMAARAKAARMFLEQQYRDKRLGVKSVSDARQAIQKKVNLQSPSYALAFYLCRAGAWDYGVEEITKMGDSDGQFREYLLRVSKANTPNPMSNALIGEGESNPFRRALLNLSDPKFETQDASIIGSIEDFLWLRMCAVVSSSDDKEIERRLEELIRTIKQECGPDYFGAGSNPFLYARVLATCGDLEGAIDFLSTFFPNNKQMFDLPSVLMDPLPDAVHMAIVLRFARKLRMVSSTSPPDSSSRSTNFLLGPELKYVQLMETYASRFGGDAERAMVYVTMPFPQPSESDLVSARKILSRPAPNGGPIRLLKVLKQNVEDVTVARRVAMDAAQNSRPIDAVNLLYDTADSENDSKVVADVLDQACKVVNKELARVMNISGNPDRSKWSSEAARLLQLITGKNLKLDSSKGSFETLRKVRDCVEFYDLFAKGDENAPVKLESWLFPSHESKINTCVEEFSNLDRLLIDAFPGLVSASVECHQVAYQRNKQEDAKRRLKLLVAFIAALREQKGYRLRSDVERELALTESRVRV